MRRTHSTFSILDDSLRAPSTGAHRRSWRSFGWIGLVAFVVGLVLVPSWAWAGPSGSASVSTERGAKSSGKGSGYDWPEVVVGGNAISAQVPLQFGIVNYLPKGRFAFQYDRQLRKGHWIHAGLGIVFDHAGWQNFRMGRCGLEAQSGACDKGGVVGFDLFAGYSYKFYLRDRPWLVPIARASIGYSYFALPKVGGGDGTREQTRTHTTALTLKPGGGIRIFLLSTLGIGSDINLPLGALIFRDVPDGVAPRRNAGFLLGIEVLPIVVEYRF
jgi:hypothetical protein